MALIEAERSAARPAPTSNHEERAVAFFSTWALIGLYLDGWAHIHDKPETFFSPWHGVLYSGVGAAVVYFAFREYVLRRPSVVSDRWLTWGFVIFGAGAVGDFVWHELFGIEVGLEALLSPTHLMLLTGGLLMVSFPARAAAARAEGRDARFLTFLPVIVSLTLTAMLVGFFTQYFAAHRFGELWASAPGQQDMWEVLVIGSVFVTNAILVAVMLFALRRWDVPFGTFTVLWGATALGVSGMYGFEAYLHVPAAIAGGLAADVLRRVLRPGPERRGSTLVFIALVPFVAWSLWMAAVVAMGGVHWSIHLWAGLIYLAALQGLGMAVLTSPGPRTD